MPIQFTGFSRSNRVAVYRWLPKPPRHFHSSPRHTHILQAIINYLRIYPRILQTEISPNPVKGSSRMRSVNCKSHRFSVNNSGSINVEIRGYGFTVSKIPCLYRYQKLKGFFIAWFIYHPYWFFKDDRHLTQRRTKANSSCFCLKVFTEGSRITI